MVLRILQVKSEIFGMEYESRDGDRSRSKTRDLGRMSLTANLSRISKKEVRSPVLRQCQHSELLNGRYEFHARISLGHFAPTLDLLRLQGHGSRATYSMQYRLHYSCRHRRLM